MSRVSQEAETERDADHAALSAAWEDFQFGGVNSVESTFCGAEDVSSCLPHGDMTQSCEFPHTHHAELLGSFILPPATRAQVVKD